MCPYFIIVHRRRLLDLKIFHHLMCSWGSSTLECLFFSSLGKIGRTVIRGSYSGAGESWPERNFVIKIYIIGAQSFDAQKPTSSEEAGRSLEEVGKSNEAFGLPR